MRISLQRLCAFLITLVFIFSNQYGYAQKNYTKNTLKLEDPKLMPKASIENVSWIAGHWKGEMFGGVGEEVWSKPFGGTMMGMYKLVSSDTVKFYELMILVEESNSLILKLKHFNSNLSGWEDQDEFVSFPLVKINENEVFFDGITFQKQNDDTLVIFLVMKKNNGNPEEVEIVYNRVNEI